MNITTTIKPILSLHFPALVLNLLKDVLERSKIPFCPSFHFTLNRGPHRKNKDGDKLFRASAGGRATKSNMRSKIPFNKFRASAERTERSVYC